MKHIMKSKRMVKESYEVSDHLADRLNSILADEFLAAEFYRLAELAMKGKKQHLLSEIADENGEDELEDHFKNLSEWMQSKGIRVVTNHDEMLDITNGTVFTVEDGDSTEEIVDKLIQSEEEAIEAYENLIPDTDIDLRVMLCGFLKDEREHLKALTDARDEMEEGGFYDGEDSPKDYEDDVEDDFVDDEEDEVSVGDNEEGDEEAKAEDDSQVKVTVNESLDDDEDGVDFVVKHIDWDVDDPSERDDLPTSVIVTVPSDVVACDGEEEYISDWLSDEYGFCHNGFLFNHA